MRVERDHTNRRVDTLVQGALLRLTLKISCRQCDHVRLLDAIPVWFRFERKGWSGRMADVPERLHCGTCARLTGRKVLRPRVEFTDDLQPPPTPDWPYPDERVWKRLVARYRS